MSREDWFVLSNEVCILIIEKARDLEVLIPAPVEGTVPLHIHSIVEAQLLTRTQPGGER